MYYNTVALAIYVGFNNGSATLISQSIGQGNLRLAGIYLNRGRFISLLSLIPIFLALFFAYDFFILIGIDAETSTYGQNYIYTLMPSLFFNSQYDITRTFLNCFEHSDLPMYTNLITTCLHALWCYILVNKLGYGYLGTGFSTSFTSILNFAIITIYVTYFMPFLKESWFFP